MKCEQCGTGPGRDSNDLYKRRPWLHKAWACTNSSHFPWQMACMADLSVPERYAQTVGFRVRRNERSLGSTDGTVITKEPSRPKPRGKSNNLARVLWSRCFMACEKENVGGAKEGSERLCGICPRWKIGD